jgi:Uma2 family endonuclease
MSAQHIPRFTPEQYLEMERAADYKSEYFQGEIFAMAGASYAHVRLTGNLTGEIYQSLRGKSCFIGPSEMRVRTRPNGLYTYPDNVAICGEPVFADAKPDTLVNPILIVEVLSKSTEAHDRGDKLHEYRASESLQQYVLVSQYAPRIEVFTRSDDNTWSIRYFEGEDTICELTSVGCSFRLADVYRGVPLEPGPTQADLLEK